VQPLTAHHGDALQLGNMLSSMVCLCGLIVWHVNWMQWRVKEMTKKDYELIANVIHQAKYTANIMGPDCSRIYRKIAVDMADRLAGNNSRFDRDKFLKACGVE